MKKNKIIAGALIFFGVMALYACRSKVPAGDQPVKNFKADKYLGKWYEIARLPEFFERNMTNATAEYSLNQDGTIKVLNKGFDTKKNKFTEAEGVAKFTGDKDIASLKVSFFGPFYAGYNVIKIDADYRYALVAGDSRKHLWLLSRSPTMPDSVKNDFIATARSLGFETENLFWTPQELHQ